MRPFLHQSGDHSAQSQQRLVDVSRLASSLVHRTRAPDVLTAGEIHLEREGGVNTVLMQWNMEAMSYMSVESIFNFLLSQELTGMAFFTSIKTYIDDTAYSHLNHA